MVRLEGFSGEVDDLVTYLIVTCNCETSVAAAERMIHQKGQYATVISILEVWVFNVITST